MFHIEQIPAPIFFIPSMKYPQPQTLLQNATVHTFSFWLLHLYSFLW